MVGQGRALVQHVSFCLSLWEADRGSDFCTVLSWWVASLARTEEPQEGMAVVVPHC